MKLKRTLAILAIGAIGALALAPSAGAIENPKMDPYGAGAYANALEIGLLNNTLAVSNTSAAITSTPEAKADGAALLLAGNPIPGATPSAAPDGKATNQTCALDLDLGELTGGAIDLADAHLACVTTSAVADATKTEATSQSGEVIINVTAPAGDILSAVLTPLRDQLVPGVVGPLLDALAPILNGVKDLTQIDLDKVITDLLDDLLSVDPNIVIAQVSVAPTHAIAQASNAGGVLADASSATVKIDVLPNLLKSLSQLVLPNTLTKALVIPAGQLNDPLASVTVGASNAKVSRDPVTGVADPDASVAELVDVSLTPALGIVSQLTGALGGAIDDVADALSGVIGCKTGLLKDVLCIDLGQVTELSTQELQDRNLWFGDGTVGREATAATVKVLSLLGPGGLLELRLGASTAAANAKPKAAVPAPPAGPAKLPKTGGAAPLSLGVVLLLGAGGAVALVRRTRSIV